MNSIVSKDIAHNLPGLAARLRYAENRVQEQSGGFRSQLKLPKGVNKYMVARAVDLVLLHDFTVDDAARRCGLVAAEREQTRAFLAEYREWAEKNKKTSIEPVPVSAEGSCEPRR